MNKPTGLWSTFPKDMKDPRFQYPPGKYLVVNGSGKRISFVKSVDWDTEKVCRCVTSFNERGEETVLIRITEDGTKQLDYEWIDVPGVNVVPMPEDYEADLIAKKKKKYTASPEGLVAETVPSN